MPKSCFAGRPERSLRRHVLSLGALLLSGWKNPAAAAHVLRIGGTGSSLAALRLLAAGHRRAHPDVEIQVLPSLGSTGGIRALQAGVIDLAVASRALTPAEQASGLQATEYAQTLLVFVANPAVNAGPLSLERVARIYAGELMTWPSGMPIRLIRRPPTEADWETLADLSPAMAAAVQMAMARPGLITAASDQDNADTIETLRGAFGLATLGQILSERRNLTPLALDGIEPSLDALAQERQPLRRSLFLITRARVSPEATAFLNFVLGEGGKAILESCGYAAPGRPRP